MAVASKYGEITDAAIEELRNRAGLEIPIESPWVTLINRDSIVHAARAVGDANPLYLDRAYAEKSRHGRLVAPPSILAAIRLGASDSSKGEGLPGVHRLNAGETWVFHRPLYDGDEVHAIKTFTEPKLLEGRWAGKSVLHGRVLNIYDSTDLPVAKCTVWMIAGVREEGKVRGKYTDIAEPHYTPEEIDAIYAEVAGHPRRGSDPRFWEDVVVGEELPTLTKPPLTISDMIAWVMGAGSPFVRTGDFWVELYQKAPKAGPPDARTGIPEPVERVHWDDAMAAEIGMPRAFDYGANRAAWGMQLVTNWGGDDSFLIQFDVQQRGMVFIGDTVRTAGTVTDKWRGSATGTGFVEVEIRATTQRGDVVMPGTAVLALPSREAGFVQFPLDITQERQKPEGSIAES